MPQHELFATLPAGWEEDANNERFVENRPEL